MRVALLTAEYPPLPGGMGDYTLCLGQALGELGVDVQVITSPVAADARSLGDSRTALGAYEPPRQTVAGWSWGCWSAVASLLRALRPDLLHIQYQTGAYAMHPAINLLPRALRVLGPRLPVVVTCHDLRLPYLLPKADILRRWVTHRLLADSDRVIVTNAEDAGRLRGELPGDRTIYAARKPLHPVVIPIGSNIAVARLAPERRVAWRARLGASDSEVVLAYFGLTNRSKGVDALLRALALLGEGYRLAIIGGEAGSSDPDNRRYAAELEALAAELGVAGRIWRSGQLSADEVSLALQACDMAALPFRDGASYRRGSMLATLAHGLPLISTRPARPLDPPLRDGVEALLLDEALDLPQQIAAAARRLAADPDLRARIGRAGQALADAFSWPQIAERHKMLYTRIIANSR